MIEVQLRDVVDDDIPIFFEHQNDPAAAAIAAFPPRGRDAFVTHWTLIQADPSVITQSIVADGVVVGNIVCFDEDGERQVGYWLGRKHWGQGIATRALGLLLAKVQSRPLHARVAKANGASIRVLEKCGFQRVGEELDDILLRLSHDRP